MMIVWISVTLAALAIASPTGTARQAALPDDPTDSAAVLAAVDAFHAALGKGDSAAALALLVPDARILEAGGVETVAQYRAGHLPADIEFARSTSTTAGSRAVAVRGDAAWVSSVSRVRGEFRGRTIDVDSAELAVLIRAETGWRIVAVHWSSRRHAD